MAMPTLALKIRWIVIPDDYLIVLLNLVSDTLLPGQTRCDRVTPSISCTEGEITLI